MTPFPLRGEGRGDGASAMDRRVFLGSLALGILAAPLTAKAQQPGKVPVVGVLNAGPADTRSLDVARQGLRELGYVEGKTILLEVRHSKGSPEVLPALPDLTGKWLELIRDVAPGNRRVALLWDPTTGDRQLAAVKAVGPGLGMDLQILQAQNLDHLEHVLASGAKGKPGALVELSTPLFERYQEQIADFAPRHRLPAASISSRFDVDAEAPPEFGSDGPVGHEPAGVRDDKILKGAKPGDLPIEQASKFELTVNRKTAKALGLTLPQTLLGRADRVIE